MSHKKSKNQSILSDMPPAKAIVKLAIPATLALLAKAVYNLADTAYIRRKTTTRIAGGSLSTKAKWAVRRQPTKA